MRAWGQLAVAVGFLVLGVLMLIGGGSSPSRLWGFGYLAIAAGWGFLPAELAAAGVPLAELVEEDDPETGGEA